MSYETFDTSLLFPTYLKLHQIFSLPNHGLQKPLKKQLKSQKLHQKVKIFSSMFFALPKNQKSTFHLLSHLLMEQEYVRPLFVPSFLKGHRLINDPLIAYHPLTTTRKAIESLQAVE